MYQNAISIPKKDKFNRGKVLKQASFQITCILDRKYPLWQGLIAIDSNRDRTKKPVFRLSERAEPGLKQAGPTAKKGKNCRAKQAKTGTETGRR
jgi:hypothetical protein